MTCLSPVALCGAALPLLLGLVLAQTPTSQPPVSQTPTYTREVQPILQAACVSCHRSGGIAPFSLETYQAAAPKASLIVNVTAQRQMPPWMPGGKTPPLKYARTLTDEQIRTLAAWAAAGAKE